MHDILAGESLRTIELARLDTVRLTGGKPISRASVARVAGVNDAALWRGLDGRAVTRASTVARAAGGLLTRIVQEISEKESIVPESFAGQVMEAAYPVARAVGEAVASDGDANSRRRLKARLEKLDDVLDRTVFDHYRAEKALAHLAHAWLADPDNHGLRLGAAGAAIAVANGRPTAGKPEAAEAAHV